ncbi:MAG: glycosyltransferase [Chloroflexi bacterium]|nr:MAG: glycosyltransferase [Chloroflexota bacterium]
MDETGGPGMALPAAPAAMALPADDRSSRLRDQGIDLRPVGWRAVANDRSAARLSIVVPCYNEEQRLPHTIEQIERYLDGKPESYELILVDDGSTDGTRLIMDAAAERHNAVRVEALPANKGKGRALATGVATAKGSEILVTDADLSTPIEELDKLQAALDNGAQIAIGSRGLRGSCCPGCGTRNAASSCFAPMWAEPRLGRSGRMVSLTTRKSFITPKGKASGSPRCP